MLSLVQFRPTLFFFLFVFVLPFAVRIEASETIDHSAWNRLLHRFTREGLVDYQGLLQEKKQLEDYLKHLEEVSIEELSATNREERVAFWVNLYNASVIRMVLDSYPVERIDQIPAVFEIRTVRALGDFFSLTELRDEVLRQGFRDERILTALVSGRMDSPRLLGEAYTGEQLEAQLDRAAHQFAEDEFRNEIKPGSKRVFLSPLFREFGKDFILNFSSQGQASGFSETETAVVSFLLHHLKNPDKRLFLDSCRYQIKYFSENPKLNDVKNHGR